MSDHSPAAVRCPARELAALASADRLAVGDLIAARVKTSYGAWPTTSAISSWSRGLATLARDLVEAELGDVEMLVEYQLPLTSERADVVLAGVDQRTGEDTYVIVELKSWSRAELYERNPALVLPSAGNGHPVLHPLLQVQGYCDYLVDFLDVVKHRPDAVHGVAYLHNAEDAGMDGLYALAEEDRFRLFSKSQRAAFLRHLRERFAPQSGMDAADRLVNSTTLPTKQLLKFAAEEIRSCEQFVLLGDQRLAYEIVMDAVGRTRATDSKEVVIVTGGPGSGKSLVALSLLGELSRQERAVLHATGSRSLTETLRRVPGKGSSRVKSLFKYFNSFMQADWNGLDVLICDEAHRIRETSQNRYTPARLRSDRRQIDELIDAARVPVFLLDERQVVRPGELGTVTEIREHAEARRFRVHEVSLNGQFRCGGSRAYEQWVLRLLGLNGDGSDPAAWTSDDRFTVSLADSPYELESLLRDRHEKGYSARMTAGFCWPWSDPRKDDTLVPDVRIGDWSRPWSVKSDRAVGDAPPSVLWATQDGGFEQVGMVYTAQGFEYDWSGVIIGPDLVYRDGRMITVRAANRDPALTRRVTDEQADRLIRNTYKVLLTRGVIGTVVYSVDPATQEFLAKLLPNVRE
ncbi:DNA/RNA helicase domain-containing protein [Streptosporangium sandarakinum]